MKNHLYIVILLLLGGSINYSFAQDNWENDGEIEDVEIEIVKDREIKLPKANRNFEKIAPMSLSNSQTKIDYKFADLQLPLPSINIRVRPLRIKDEPLNKLYGNYVRVGFGNYITPYFEGYFTSKRSRNQMYGAHVNYLNSINGPVDSENSGSGKMDAEVFGKYFGSKVTVGGDVGFKRRSYNFYGYQEGQPLSTDSLAQHFNDIYLRGYLENTDKSDKLNYYTGIQFDYLKDNYNAEESEVQLDLISQYKLGDQGSINLKSDLDIISQKDVNLDVKTRNIFRVTPTFTFEYEGFLIDAGFNVVYENDTLGDSDEIHFYPVAKARYMLTSGFEVYAGIKGDVEKQTLRQLTSNNPYLEPNTRAFNGYNTFEFFGGIGGALTSKLGFGANMSLSNHKNMAFFINSPNDVSKFLTVYDIGNTTVLNINGQLSYNRNDILRLTLRGDYWGYDTDKISEPYHRPNYKLSTLMTYNLFDKLRFEVEGYMLGGIKAYDPITNQDKDLDSVIDLNLNSEYLFSEQFSAFVRLNNLLSAEYELLYNYPVRGFQVMAGVTYSF